MKTRYIGLMIFASLVTANAQQHPINISSEANGYWCEGAINCTTLPYGTHTYDGVTFHIPGTATTNNFWAAAIAAKGGNAKVSVTIPINVAGVKTVYTLMNTDWGSTAAGLLSVTFTGSGGATWTASLREHQRPRLQQQRLHRRHRLRAAERLGKHDYRRRF